MSTPDHFALLGLAPRFALDLGELEAAYKRVQAQVHPDRFAVASAAEKRVAMQWATRANEAFTVLRDPQQRAAYLCELHGVPIEAESNMAMPTSFLMQQMQWREALDEVADDAARAQLRSEVDAVRATLLSDLGRALDAAHDYRGAAALVRQLMFIDRFSSEVAHAARVAEGH
jgi:molecular chaperone HscB